MKNIKLSEVFDPTADFTLFEGNTIDLLATMPAESAKLIVTSPPYNLGKSYEKKTSIDAYLSFQRIVIEQCVRVLQKNGSICWQVGNFVDNGEIIPLDIILYPFFSSLGCHLRNRIIWHFEHGLHTSKRFSGRYEVILWFTKNVEYTFNLDAIRVPQKYPQKKYFKGPKKGQLSCNPLGKNPGDVWEIPNVKANHVEKTIHPCQFPVELVERLVLSLTNPGDLVLDSFMGVGSSAIAALLHDRKAIGAEIIHDYVVIAKQRILLAEEGKLRIRPMERQIYDRDSEEKSIPPKYVQIGDLLAQPALFEPEKPYIIPGEKQMKIVYEYSHLGGAEILQVRYPDRLKEIYDTITGISANRSKISKEKTMAGKELFSPVDMNNQFKGAFRKLGYNELRDTYAITLPKSEIVINGAFKQVDFVKDKILIEVQFGKYAFMFYDMAKFQYFFNENKADVGIEIVPSHSLHKQMSTGVSYGEQLVYDIERLKRHFPAVPVKVILIDV